MWSRRESIRLLCKGFVGSSVFCRGLFLSSLFFTVFETMASPNCLTSETALRKGVPHMNSLSFQNGFWNRSPIAPEAKSKDLEKGNEAGISI